MRALSSARIPMRLGEGGWTLLAHWSDPPQALANFNPSGVATTLSSLLIVFCYRRNIFTGPVDLHENDDVFSRSDNFSWQGTTKSHSVIEEGSLPTQRTRVSRFDRLRRSTPSCFWTIWVLGVYLDEINKKNRPQSLRQMLVERTTETN